jgi:shikimate dehydrogenase
MSEVRLFAIAGNPALHSRSPQMFHTALGALGIDNCFYLRFAASGAEEVLQVMREVPVYGFNVTSPFKEEIVPLLDDLDETARRIGAVNAIITEGDRFKGFNTDVVGVEGAFSANGVELAGKRAVVLGAGGAARAAVAALARAGAEVVIVNRTVKKAELIAESFNCGATSMEDLEKEIDESEILVSCLPGGIHVVPIRSLRRGLIILDANYGEKAILAGEGASHGCMVIDGSEWLLYQGLAVFSLFTGLTNPPVEAMRKSVSGKHTFSKSNIALIGFMGTGKSAVGRLTSEKLKLPFIDVDSEIEKRNNASIEEIFGKYGEETFRKMEASEIERVSSLPGRVIACGGGAVLNKSSMNYLSKHCIIIWLWANIDTIIKRTGDNGARPLLKVKDKRSEVETMLTFRKPYYAEASDLFISTDHKKPREIAERICNESAQFLKN